jgi:hypothetical protein
VNANSERASRAALNVHQIDAKSLKSGASDGTRTRDLRRDRPGKQPTKSTELQSVSRAVEAEIDAKSERACGHCCDFDRRDVEGSGATGRAWCFVKLAYRLAGEDGCSRFEAA